MTEELLRSNNLAYYCIFPNKSSSTIWSQEITSHLSIVITTHIVFRWTRVRGDFSCYTDVSMHSEVTFRHHSIDSPPWYEEMTVFARSSMHMQVRSWMLLTYCAICTSPFEIYWSLTFVKISSLSQVSQSSWWVLIYYVLTCGSNALSGCINQGGREDVVGHRMWWWGSHLKDSYSFALLWVVGDKRRIVRQRPFLEASRAVRVNAVPQLQMCDNYVKWQNMWWYSI